MPPPLSQNAPRPSAEIIDFDTAFLAKFSPDRRSQLIEEAFLLARVFAPDGQPDEIESVARALSMGARDDEMGRAHARRLAAALRHLARDAA